MTGRYQIYEEFTSTEEVIIEDFPKHWDLTRIKFNSLVKARVGWHGLKSDDFTEEGPYLVTGSDFKGKFIQWDNCYHCDEERYQQDSYIQLQNGDLLLTKDGTIGKVALVSGLDDKATLNSGVFVVRPLKDGDFTTKYYYWLLLSRSFTDFVDFYKTGSTIVHLYQDTFVNFKYSLPPLAEQQKIANFLDHETAKIDTLIAKQEKLIELLKEKRQAIISHAVTHGLNPDAPMKDSGVEWLGKVPRHWKASKLKNYTTQIVDGAHFTPTYTETGVPFLRVTDVTSKTIDFNKIKYIPESEHKDLIKRCNPQKGDLLLSKNGTIGVPKVINWDYEFSIFVSLCLIKFKPELSSKYAFYVFKSYQIAEQINSGIKQSTVINLHLDKIENFYFSIPPIDEQNQIILELERKTLKLDTLINKATTAIELIKERKTALISAAVTGKIDVRNYNTEKAGI